MAIIAARNVKGQKTVTDGVTARRDGQLNTMNNTVSPAYQWYPKDALASSRLAEMSLAEEGAYRRLLDYCWLNDSVPADPKRAARVIGKGATPKMAAVCLQMFIPHPDDPSKMIHDRLEDERDKQRKWRVKSSNGGKQSAETREQKDQQKAGNGHAEPTTKGQPHVNQTSTTLATKEQPNVNQTSTTVATKGQPKGNIPVSCFHKEDNSNELSKRESAYAPRAPASDPPPPSPVLVHGLNSVEMFSIAFPAHRLTLDQKRLLAAQVRDGPRWETALKYWADNAYRPASIGKLLAKYHELEHDNEPTGKHRPNGSRPSNADTIRAQQAALEPLRGIDPIEAFRIRD